MSAATWTVTDEAIDHALARLDYHDDHRAILCVLFHTPIVESPYGDDELGDVSRIGIEVARAVFALHFSGNWEDVSRADVRAGLRALAGIAAPPVPLPSPTDAEAAPRVLTMMAQSAALAIAQGLDQYTRAEAIARHEPMVVTRFPTRDFTLVTEVWGGSHPQELRIVQRVEDL